jgi:tetratricopeptide (TPR) repeat protein
MLVIAMLLGVMSCNPTRDRWLNRNWHTMTGHYNVYFNGQIKFDEAVTAFEKGAQNDFNKILPVFIIPDEATAKGMSGTMDEVIKKTSTSIQMHYVGRYTDDSYFLMAKAQYYKRDFFAALETFQYINTKYKDGDLTKASTAWIARCYDGLNKQGEAEAVMGLLISEVDPIKMYGRKKVPQNVQNKSVKITKKQRSFIYATAADIYIKQEKYTLAADRLKVALANATDKPSKIRYNYILGQLYLLSDSVPQAKRHFSKVIKLISPYDFEFNANLNLTRTYDPENKKEVKQVKRNLKRMLRDDKNQGLYDQVYYELARVEHRDKNIPAAIKYYQLSAAKSTKNQAQKAESYLALGNIYLEMPNYRLGQAYYDSAAQVIPKDHKNYQKVQDKKTVLSELISNILTIETQDSLQRLSKLSKTELERKVDQWILAKKQREEADAKAAAEQREIEKQNELNRPAGGTAPGLPSLGGDQGGQWYFYNTSVMNTGQQEFFSQRKWGRRDNEDFWRIAAKEKVKNTSPDAGDGDLKKDSALTKGNDSGTGEPGKPDATDKPQLKEDKGEWVKDIPYTPGEKKASDEKIIEAYYNLGMIYDQKLKDNPEATASFNTLLNRFPENDYEPEVLYYLFRLYNAQKETSKAEQVKAELIRKYPDSKYALILQNKSIQTDESNINKEIVAAYEKLYREYESGNYVAVKQGKHDADKKYSGNAIQGKFDLLYAMAVGKTDSLSVFKAELEDIVKAYPSTDVSDRAQRILDAIKKQAAVAAGIKDTTAQEEAKVFKLMPEGVHYYLFATLAEKLDINDLLQKMANYNDEYHQFENLRANTMMSTEGYQVIYIREFPKLESAVAYMKGLDLTAFYKNNLPADVKFVHFAVEKEEFKRILKEKKIAEYNKFFSEQFPQLLNQQKK